MTIENPLAFSFIMQDELYLLDADRAFYTQNNAALPQHLTEQTPADNFNYYGGNKKNFLVAGFYPETEFMEDADLNALKNILKRLDLSVDDIALFNTARSMSAGVAVLKEFFRPRKMLLLGNAAVPGDMEPAVLNQVTIINGCSTLLSFSFDEMMNNTENKRIFWEQMKLL